MLPHIADGIALRRLDPLDLADFQAYRCDPVVGRYQGWTPLSDAAALAFLNEYAQSALLQPGRWSQMAVCRANCKRLIGDIGIYIADDARHAEVGFSLARESQGQGLATRAVQAALDMVFTHTPVDRVIGVTDARNTASVRLLLRLGMQHERSTDTVFRGEPCTEQTYALLRPSRLAPSAFRTPGDRLGP